MRASYIYSATPRDGYPARLLRTLRNDAGPVISRQAAIGADQRAQQVQWQAEGIADDLPGDGAVSELDLRLREWAADMGRADSPNELPALRAGDEPELECHAPKIERPNAGGLNLVGLQHQLAGGAGPILEMPTAAAIREPKACPDGSAASTITRTPETSRAASCKCLRSIASREKESRTVPTEASDAASVTARMGVTPWAATVMVAPKPSSTLPVTTIGSPR